MAYPRVGTPVSPPLGVVGADGEAVRGSIAELTTFRIGGHPQAIMLRGGDASAPVLLHLAGGPGGTGIGAMRLDTGLEQHFVVATWDQRDTGKSYPAFGPAETLTLDRVVADTVEVTEHLIDRFGHDRILIADQSWGTLPATLAAHRRDHLGTGVQRDRQHQRDPRFGRHVRAPLPAAAGPATCASASPPSRCRSGS